MERERVRAAVEQAIADYGGEVVKGIVLWQLRNRFHLDPGDAVDRPEDFVSALKEIYGSFEGSIERRICERIALELGVNYSGEGLIELSVKIRKGRR